MEAYLVVEGQVYEAFNGSEIFYIFQLDSAIDPALLSVILEHLIIPINQAPFLSVKTIQVATD